MNSKKAIILLHSSHEPNIERLQESLLSYCKDNNFTVIKTIIADQEYDCQILTGLINLINSQVGPINLIVTNNSLNELFHIFTYTVIATLLEARLIDRLYIYRNALQTGDTGKLSNHPSYTTTEEELQEVKNSLLPFCAEYYKAMVMINKIETFYDEESKLEL